MDLRTCLPRRMARIAMLLAIAAAPLAHADPLPDATERVIGLARVWAKAKFYHPYLAYKDIDWDAALVAAIPRAEAATTVVEYRAAVQGMLAALGDPVTRVVDAPPSEPPRTAPAEWLTTPSPGVLEVKIAAFVADGMDFVGMRNRTKQVETEAAKAKVLVVDLRAPGADAESVADAVYSLRAALPAIEEWPLERSIEHHGFRTQGAIGGTYYSTFVTTGALPPKPAPRPGVSQVVFVTAADSTLPGVALALQAAGSATIITSGALGEHALVSTVAVELPGKLSASIRLGELLWGPPRADVTVARNQDPEARALALARSLVAAPARPRPKKLVPLPPLRARDDLDYADQPYPSRELRILAGIRLWAVVETFFPYHYLITDWDRVLRETLPRLADAPDRDAYRRVLRQMGVAAGDGHINVRPAIPDPAIKPYAFPPFATRLVEGKLAVVRLLDAAEASKQGVALGDVIETIDGKPVAGKLAEARGETSGSTEEARDQGIAALALKGDDGSSVQVGVRGADGRLRELTLGRSVANLRAMMTRPTPHWRKLPGNIGYADLSTLLVPEVGPMFEDFKDTRAIVFDMRGYPNGTAWSIAPRVNTKKAKYGAEFLQPLRSGRGGEQADQRVRFLQLIPELPKDAWIYTGKIVVLIDERAVSQAEHTCLFLESTAGAKFVGSPTHGANGDITYMRLPGGLRMSFTGQEVRHVDGRQLQKVGIQPDIPARPTIAGVRAGKDEVLERALAYLTANR